MAEHPIQGLISTAMSSIKEMVDVNTIVGDAVETPDGTVIIPISKVGFGFGAGGGEYPSAPHTKLTDREEKNATGLFGGGSAAGVSICPVAFLVVGQGQIKLLPITSNSTVADKIIDYIPTAIDKINDIISKKDKQAAKVTIVEET